MPQCRGFVRRELRRGSLSSVFPNSDWVVSPMAGMYVIRHALHLRCFLAWTHSCEMAADALLNLAEHQGSQDDAMSSLVFPWFAKAHVSDGLRHPCG